MNTKVMQIGYGYWGSNVAKKLMASSMFDFAYLAESDEIHRRNASEQYAGKVEILSAYEHVLDTDIDAVAICTQTQYSYEIAMKAMEHGKHVFIEKPLAINAKRAEELIAMAHKKRVVLHCDHLMVYNPIIRYIKKMIERGEIGDVMYIDISRVNLGPVRKDINAMLDLAVHDIAVIDYLIDGLLPDEMSAYGTKFYGDQETITYLTMKQENILMNINSSWVSPVKVRRTLIGGTKKMVIFDDVRLDDKLRVYDSGIDVKQGSSYGEYEFKTRTGDIYIPYIANEDSLLNSLEHFASCVQNGTESLSGPAQSMRVMKVLEQAQEMLKNKAV